MKTKGILALLMGGMIAIGTALPCSAAEAGIESTTVVYQLENGITVEETIWEASISTFAAESQKRGTAYKTYRRGSDVIATVSLTATFWYDGSDSGVVSTDSSYSVYDGWSYTNESIWDSGNTAYLSAELTNLFIKSIDVSLSLSCSPSGQLS